MTILWYNVFNGVLHITLFHAEGIFKYMQARLNINLLHFFNGAYTMKMSITIKEKNTKNLTWQYSHDNSELHGRCIGYGTILYSIILGGKVIGQSKNKIMRRWFDGKSLYDFIAIPKECKTHVGKCMDFCDSNYLDNKGSWKA